VNSESKIAAWPGVGYMPLKARHAANLQTVWDVRFSMSHLAGLVKTNYGKVLEMRTMVPQVLSSPHSVWRGLMREADEDGWCYAGVPDHAYVGKGAIKVAPPKCSIFLVFINCERTIYEWYWYDVDPTESRFPLNHAQRFKENLL
jgi:hypothetical protein